MNNVIRWCSRELEAVASGGILDSDSQASDNLAQGWQTPYHALTVFSKVLRDNPGRAADEGTVDWPSVVSLLLYPHAWVRSASCRLVGTLFAAVPAAAPSGDGPVFSREGMEEVATKLTLQLRSEHLDEPLGLQIVKNLFYVGKCFCALEVRPRSGEDATIHDVEEEGDDINNGADADGQDSEAEMPTEEGSQHPLSRLFSRLSFQARSALIRRRNKARSPVRSILTCISSLFNLEICDARRRIGRKSHYPC